jgi:hypothetical protein
MEKICKQIINLIDFNEGRCRPPLIKTNPTRRNKMKSNNFLNMNLIHLTDGHFVKVKHVVAASFWLAIFMVILNLTF